eukprot:372875-Pyramimonas_sp.AAC.1
MWTSQDAAATLRRDRAQALAAHLAHLGRFVAVRVDGDAIENGAIHSPLRLAVLHQELEDQYLQRLLRP